MDSKTPEYYDNINLDLLNGIPLTSQRVLEIGCGPGRLGMEFKKRNPGSSYFGVEIEAPAAAIAASRLDMVLCGSVETIDLGFLNGSLDCIVYGDVLEHLGDPWAVLKSHRALLREGGRMLACIPNIQHWSVIASLMRGHWTYSSDGLLDITHLRFFTLGSIVALFESAGMKIDNVIGRILQKENADAFLENVKPALINLAIDEARFRECASVFQYIVHAIPQ